MRNKPEKRLVLASASARRRTLLQQIGIELTDAQIIPADIDETPLSKEKPRDTALRLAIKKARCVAGARENKNAYILAADTIVACARRSLPKTNDINQARKCIELLSSRRHHVFGGICLITPDGKEHTRLCDTVVKFKRLAKEEIEHYLQSNEWQGKAGSYAIQGQAAAFIPFIQGSYSNIVGLSLYDTMQILKGSGYFLINK